MELSINGLTDNEEKVIACTIINGFEKGSLNNLDWFIEYQKHDWENEEDDINYIASLIEQGFTSGYYPSWQLRHSRG